MRPLFNQLLTVPSRLAAKALSSVSRGQPVPVRAGQPADPFDRLTAMVAAERRREALRQMRAAA
jgi:hypothetical protein